ncbi:asparagine--tRNA ligase [Vulgatibacter incomptus]|uniref:Asparagine--tRNA ligase n=1 Tax=Vulgatibacter incomptus TaxID=1391653 RepID=A0A0K1PBU2_9BACT|nr:asparagine--tRNA ligase [Vulgatibacter incomptus]AKU90589.1 Asparaginyl-tRNA synthetase [Vulgatibacter incomptus]
MSFPRAWINEIGQYEGQDVELRGWLDNRRSSGKLHFLQVRDGTGVIQCVMFKGDVSEALFQEADHLPQESAIKVRGSVRADARSPLGFELSVKDLEVVSRAEPDFPIGRKEHGVAFLMEKRHLWLRSSRQRVVMAVRHTIIKAIRDYFDGHGFRLTDAPIFTPAACEGTSTLFEVPYFEMGKAYLTQSGQLYGEAAAMAYGKVYTFGPTFRAEKSKTRRHLTEFWMVEPEVAFMDLDEDMDLAEDFLCFIAQRVLENHAKELASILERDVSKLETVKKPFPRITYDEAVKVLQAAGNPIKWGDDFGGDEETILCSQYDRPVMVHRYPADLKAFYFKHDPTNPKLALGVDVLAPEGYGEIIGGGQREESFDTLVARIEAHQLPREAFEWYLDLRRWGSVPHSGFGLGVERTVAWMCGLHHVRETIPFPRMMERLTP